MVDIPLLIRDLVFFLLVALVVNLITAKLSVRSTLGLVIVGLGIGFVGLARDYSGCLPYSGSARLDHGPLARSHPLADRSHSRPWLISTTARE